MSLRDKYINIQEDYNMKKQYKIFVALTILLSLLPMTLVPASANSRAQEWKGTDANGVIFVGDSVPIEVTGELLTFDIPTLPYASYRDAETFIEYDSKVTAEYTFHNPTDMTVTATLLFPFGSTPEYYRIYDSFSGKMLFVDDLAKYGVTVNGKKADATVRHTPYVSAFGSAYDWDVEASKLNDSFITDDLYHPELAVTKYTYKVSRANRFDDSSIKFYFDIINPGKNRTIYCDKMGDYIKSEENKIVATTSFGKNDYSETVSFYVLGEPLTEMPTVTCYGPGGIDRGDIVEGKVEFIGTESTTLLDYISSQTSNPYVSEVDLYNSAVTMIKEKEMFQSNCRIIDGVLFFDNLMRWFEYEIILEPGESITNTVTAPMYPEIVAWDRPIEYDYTYLLSPASSWADFGTLEIVINTPYEMIDCNIEGFEKTDSGYRLTRVGLPTNEEGAVDLLFTLENDGNTPLHQPARSIWERIAETVVNFFRAIIIVIAVIFDYILYLVEKIF